MIFRGKIQPEALEMINKKLNENYGNTEDKQNFRLTWSDDEREIRLCSHSVEGFQYVQPRYEERYKYRQYCRERYILEKLCVVPAQQGAELIEVISYEPLWVFETSESVGGGERLPLYPKYRAIEYIIENVLEAGRKGSYYSKPIQDPDDDPNEKEKKIRALQHELFGNETETTDALAYREAIVVPSSYNK